MPVGIDANIHCEGDFRSMPFSVLSKSSMYDASLCTCFDVPASRRANSAVRLIDDGSVQLISGSMSMTFVSHWLCFFHERLKPHRKFCNGSDPMSTFEVRGFSVNDISVPPNLKLSEKSYFQFKPSTVLRCML